MNYLNLTLHSPPATKLMHHRITTLADLMTFDIDYSNHWADALISTHFPDIAEFLDDPPTGDRQVRIGQFWSTERTHGSEGHIIEILGYTSSGFLNVRRWIPLIPRDDWFPHNINLHASSAKNRIWIHPALPGTSRGAGATDYFPLDILTGATLLHVTIGPETPPPS